VQINSPYIKIRFVPDREQSVHALEETITKLRIAKQSQFLVRIIRNS